jgi:hypothetical protein
MKAKEIIGEGLGSLVGKGLVKLGSKLAAKGAAKAAAKAAAPIADKAPSIARKVGGAMLRNPKKSIVGTIGGAGTAYNLATDPEADTWTPGGVGRAIGKTISQAGDFVGGIWQGASGGVPNAPGTAEPEQSSTKPASKEISYGEHPVPAPVPQDEAEPTNDNYGSGSYVRDVERRVRQNFEKGVQSYEPGAGQQNEAVKKKFAIAEANKEKEDPLTAIQRGIYGQESVSGKIKTDQPNYAGARGPMQIMPGTFDWMKKKKIIPQDYDIKNPEHNKQAGNALIAHYYKKYDGNTAKVAAAYYAGPGAINKDGSINTHWRDKKNPKAPTVGEYISQTQAKANLPGIAATTTLAGVPKGSGAKPSTTAEKLPPGQLIQMPDLSMGYVVGDKFVPKTTQGTGAPVDYKQAYSQAVSSGGISRAEAMRQANAELVTLRGTPREPSRPVAEPSSVIPKPPIAPDTAKTPNSKSAPAYAQAYPTKSVVPAQDTGSWDKFINTVTKGRVSPEEKGQVQVPESVNTEIQDILRLAGKR